MTWTEWGGCSASCGTGTRKSRTRDCHPAADFGYETHCIGGAVEMEYLDCTTPECVIGIRQ